MSNYISKVYQSQANNFFQGINEVIGNFFLQPSKFVIYLIWGLIFLGVFSVFWAFFLRVNNNIKTGELISRLFICGILFYILVLVTNILDISLRVK